MSSQNSDETKPIHAILLCGLIASITLSLAPYHVLGLAFAQNDSIDNGGPVSNATETGISIVPGAATLGDKAYSPSPVSVRVGDTVTWTNDDTSDTPFHTVTSGTGLDDANKGAEFDSGLAGPTALVTEGTTFSHTFNTVGEFQYFCQLHPTMVGKITVTST
ncbi:MAG: plastocyanin/azurin family copper-binding protein [Nitrososphaeraceae archaeon]